MHQPVDQGRCQGVVHVKEFAPFPEGSIRGDHDRSNFITGGDNLEQQIGPTLVDGQIAQLIEEENETTFAIVTRVSGGSMIVHPSEEKKGDHDCGALDCGRLRGRGLGRLRRSTTGFFAPISNRVGPELGSDGRVSASRVRRSTGRAGASVGGCSSHRRP